MSAAATPRKRRRKKPAKSAEPRPAVVVQTNALDDQHATVVVCPFTSELVEAPLFRVTVEPSDDNGLSVRSHVMVDKIMSLRREKIGATVGALDHATMLSVDRALAFVLAMD
jgi:mRNA interferase MazF